MPHRERTDPARLRRRLDPPFGRAADRQPTDPQAHRRGHRCPRCDRVDPVRRRAPIGDPTDHQRGGDRRGRPRGGRALDPDCSDRAAPSALGWRGPISVTFRMTTPVHRCMAILIGAAPFHRRCRLTQSRPQLVKVRIAFRVAKCLLVLRGPPLVDGGGQLVELGGQLVQVRAQGGVRCATDCWRADVPAGRTLRIKR